MHRIRALRLKYLPRYYRTAPDALRAMHKVLASMGAGWPMMVRDDINALRVAVARLDNRPLAGAPDPEVDPIYWNISRPAEQYGNIAIYLTQAWKKGNDDNCCKEAKSCG